MVFNIQLKKQIAFTLRTFDINANPIHPALFGSKEIISLPAYSDRHIIPKCLQDSNDVLTLFLETKANV